MSSFRFPATAQRSAVAAMLLACAGAPNLPASERPPPLQHQMSADEFEAAGLHKLSADELARLNAWLDRAIDTESEKAAADARREIQTRARGFLDVGDGAPIVSAIRGEFRGFGKGRLYRLANGQEWEQIDAATLAGVRKTDPSVKITPSLIGNAWYLAVDGYNTRAKVRRVK